MPGYSDEVWRKVRAEWEANQLGDREISRTFGISRPAIAKRAEAEGWVRNPKPTEVVATLVATAREEDAGGNLRASLMAYNRLMEMLIAHRAVLGRLAVLVEDQLTRVEKLIEARQASGPPLTFASEQQIASILTSAVVNFERIIAMQRGAVGLKKEDGPSEFDGFTDETLNELDRLTREALGRTGRLR